mgnify:CR=1 FL=1
MSRTSAGNNVNRVPTPVKYFVSFAGEKGEFTYWDKEAAERVSLGESIEFVVMDTRSAVGGWSDPNQARIFSNRVKSVVTEELVVRCGKETLQKGLWANIKDAAKADGAKFCTEVFALVSIGGTLQPAQIDFMGSVLGDWMNFTEEMGGPWSVYKSKVVATKGEQRKKGKTLYYAVNFTTEDLTSEDSAQADEFNDDKLQPYLNAGAPSEPVTV